MNRYLPEGRLYDCAENRAALSCADSLEKAMYEGRILEAKAVLCDSSHNLIVDLGCMKGVIAREEGAKGIAEGTVRDIAIISRVGKPVCFVVQRIISDSRGMPCAILSRRAVQEKCAAEYLSGLTCGDVIDARVTHLEPFGAFVDIGCGLPSLISIDAISVSRISHPRDRLTVGMDIRAVVRSTEPEGRISLSHRELLGTWQQNAARYRTGETVTGTVRSVEEYGIFVELTPNLAGLAEYRDGIAIGSGASVYIKSIVPERMKIKLVLVDTFRILTPPPQPEYFFTGSHMEHFVYSPEGCEKTVETIFK
ncbi:MAG: S1 RNA-binding domain-containing protein [Ruminococcaceae bacterium]|nr:S1 RNA-binding domain-containing protein [Oscillospiraceae bacterium]